MRPLLVSFFGMLTGKSADWRVVRATTLRGAPLPAVDGLAVLEGDSTDPPREAVAWTLRGVTSHRRYVTRAENEELTRRQAPIGRIEAKHAALIPIAKSDAWWELAQDERRAIFEERSLHVAKTIRFLPAIARRLHHARDLGGPFDFLTWFEWAPEADGAFDELVELLRSSEEWGYVEREIDVRLERD